jgi:hypothetical protein
MSYGNPTTPNAHTWALDDDAAQPFFRPAIEMGVTFWDTANVYQAGTSEEVVAVRSSATPAARTSSLLPRCTARCMTAPAGRAYPARPSSNRSTPRWPASAPTTSTSTRSTASIPKLPSRRPRKLSTTSLRPAKSATSAPLPCTPGIRQAAARRRATQLDPVRRDAEPVQPASTTGRAGAASHVR